MQVVSSCDIEIVTLLRKRDQQAMKILFKKYGSELYSFIYQQLGSEELTTIALKKVFSLVWDTSLSYNKAPEHFFIWLLRIAKQVSDEVNYARSRTA